MRHLNYHSFSGQLQSFATLEKLPLRVMFELTYRCNFRCRHCYIPTSYRKKRDLPTKAVLSILDELKELGCLILGFTGGEPFIRDDIMEILRRAKKNGFIIIIHTNGSLINERAAKELALIGPNKVDITLPAMTEKAFERITSSSRLPENACHSCESGNLVNSNALDPHFRGDDKNRVRGIRDKVFRAIELLHKNNVGLGLKTCLLKENVHEIKSIKKYAASLGVQFRLDDIMAPRLDGSKKPYKYKGRAEWDMPVSPSPQPSPSRGEGEGGGGGGLRMSSPFTCGAGTTQASITPQGKLNLCNGIDYPRYDIIRTSLKHAWNDLNNLAENIKPDKNYKCNKCELTSFCNWCPSLGWLEDKNFSTCDPESRRIAEAKRVYYENESSEKVQSSVIASASEAIPWDCHSASGGSQ